MSGLDNYVQDELTEGLEGLTPGIFNMAVKARDVPTLMLCLLSHHSSNGEKITGMRRC